MSVLSKLASSQNRRDSVPNQELAKELADGKDMDGIGEIARNLWNDDGRIQSDCLKVLYEIGYIDPGLIGDYVDDFFRLLKSRHNRLVWGGMIALSTIAELRADEIFSRSKEIMRAIEKGSVITVDSGIKALSLVASTKREYRQELFPYLISHLQTCRPKEIPMHAEFIMCAVDSDNKESFMRVLKDREDILRPSQLKRVRRILKQLEQV